MPSGHQIVVTTMAATASCSFVGQTIGVPLKGAGTLAINRWHGGNMICQISVTPVTESTRLRRTARAELPLAGIRG